MPDSAEDFMRRGCLIFFSLLPLIVGGCGYSHPGDSSKPTSGAYQWHSLYREDVQSVAVPIFTNKEYARGVEFSLTKAVVNAIEAHSPYKVLPPNKADTVLEGEITHVRVTTLSRNFENAVPQEQMVVLTVNFRWKDLRTGQILLERKDFEQTATYYPTVGEGQFEGNQNAIEKLAFGIAKELRADW
jgi:hypothetical protein